jgi:HEAT repeat protein
MKEINTYLEELSKENAHSSIAWEWEKFGDQILEPLLKLLEVGSSIEKYHAAHVIRQIWFRRKYQNWIIENAVENLIRNLQDVEPQTRGVTAAVLSDFRDRRALKPMIDLAQDSSDYVRWVVAWALGSFDDVRAIPALEWIRDNDTAWQMVKGQEGSNKQMNRDVASQTIDKLSKLA